MRPFPRLSYGARGQREDVEPFREDDDNRCPLVVTVDDEGLYGFKIVVQSVGGAGERATRRRRTGTVDRS